MIPPPPRSTLFPYTTLFRSTDEIEQRERTHGIAATEFHTFVDIFNGAHTFVEGANRVKQVGHEKAIDEDRKSTRLNSSHLVISYAVFCLKKKRKLIKYNTSY